MVRAEEGGRGGHPGSPRSPLSLLLLECLNPGASPPLTLFTELSSSQSLEMGDHTVGSTSSKGGAHFNK